MQVPSKRTATNRPALPQLRAMSLALSPGAETVVLRTVLESDRNMTLFVDLNVKKGEESHVMPRSGDCH